ncbi:hypothetical protein CU098_012820 [Rhizopus stolonifer]|uniref:Uncharacterized protein n=1 Tax=Rhizopus stolonifer TaxID=4846 RepID=A0A367KXF2_RHIST|nr:hypothetical protein CU098_012820 [Rhizopus stolonifer]
MKPTDKGQEKPEGVEKNKSDEEESQNEPSSSREQVDSQKDNQASGSTEGIIGKVPNVQLGYESYTAIIKATQYEESPSTNNSKKRTSIDELQQQSMIASKAEASQNIIGIFRPVENGDQKFLNRVKVSVNLWMIMWNEKRKKTDRNLQWNDIYQRINFQSPLPGIDEMLLMNINDPDALGWRLAHAFIGCLDLQGYIVMASQIIDVYHKQLVASEYLYELVDTTLRSITESETYMESIESLIFCVYYTIKKLQEAEDKDVESLNDLNARDVVNILKTLFDIPHAESGITRNPFYQGRITSFNQIMMGLTELINDSDLSWETTQKAWSAIRMNKSHTTETDEQVRLIRAQLFEHIATLIDKKDGGWNPNTIIPSIISLLEPFHGCFAPLQTALIKQIYGKVFIFKERKHPTLQTDYYSLVLREFPSLCDEHGPLVIERIEISDVGGYDFTFNDVEIDLRNIIPSQVNSKMAAAVGESAKALEKNGFVDYDFHQSSANCKIAQFYYEKKHGLPPWRDRGVAQLKIKELSIHLKVQSVSQEGLGSEIHIICCKCDIKQLDINIEQSQHQG